MRLTACATGARRKIVERWIGFVLGCLMCGAVGCVFTIRELDRSRVVPRVTRWPTYVLPEEL